MFKVH